MNEKQLNELCYFINDWLRLMGYGREYNRLALFSRDLKKSYPKFDFSKYYYINRILPTINKKIIEDNGIAYYMLDGEPVLIQKLLNTWKYWDRSWHVLTDDIIDQLSECTLSGYNKDK